MGIETIALVGMVAAAGVSALGSIQQGHATNDQMKYNAAVAEQNASAAREAAALDESTSRKKSALVQGTLRARAAGPGGDLGGSPLDLLADNASEAELEALTLRYRGEVEGRRQESEARMARYRGKNAVTQGYVGAGAALLSAAGGAYRAYGPFTKSGGGIPDMAPAATNYRPYGDK